MKILNISDTLPGDIILSSSKTLSSVAIRTFTANLKASHALIVINPVIWFEAVRPNIRYRIVDPILANVSNKKFIGNNPNDGNKYYVYRLKSIMKTFHYIDFDKLARDLVETSSLFCLLNYAEPEHFLPLLKWGMGRLRPITALAEAARQSSSSEFDGLFCSWLVALCYDNLGFDCFQGAPQTISPATIARSAEFECVGECQSNATVLPANDHMKRLWNITNDARSTLAHIDKHSSAMKDTISSLHSVLSHRSVQTILSRSGDSHHTFRHNSDCADLIRTHFREFQGLIRRMIEQIYPESYECIHDALGYVPNDYVFNRDRWNVSRQILPILPLT